MNNLSRITQYIWPYRRRLALSVVFAVMVAVLWGVNLSCTFVVVKILEGEKLADYVSKEIRSLEEEILEKESKLLDISNQISAIESNSGLSESQISDRKVEKLGEKFTKEKQLSEASRKLLGWKWIEANVMPYVPQDQFKTFLALLGLLFVATFLKGVFIFIQDVIVGGAVELTTMSLRKDCYRKTLELDYQSVSSEGTAVLMSRFTFDMQQVVEGLTLMGGKIIREPLKAISCITIAFMVNWRLTLLSLVFAPLIAFVFYRIGKMLKRASKRMMESMSRIYKTLEETFDSIKVVIAFNGAERQKKRFHDDNHEYYKKALSIVRIKALTSPTTEMMGMMAIFIATIPGIYLVLKGTNEIFGIQLSQYPMDIAELAVLYAVLAGTSDPARKLTSVYSRLKQTSAAMDRIFTILDRETMVKETESPESFPAEVKAISFEKLDFCYHTRKKSNQNSKILNGVNLNVDAGEVVLVVGENGSGKSTLVNLLPRFYDPDQGKVCINGTDIRDFSLEDLRQHVGVVSQETVLFDDSILENIRYGNPEASRTEIEAVAQKAHVLQFANQFEQGLLTGVGEKGQGLSGGQRQRIALARVMLRDPNIMILDEATSAIDSQSEILIHQALKKFVPGRTVFIITHSVGQSLLEFATRIVVMDEGQVVATGPHEILMNSCPIYQNLLTAQVSQRTA